MRTAAPCNALERAAALRAGRVAAHGGATRTPARPAPSMDFWMKPQALAVRTHVGEIAKLLAGAQEYLVIYKHETGPEVDSARACRLSADEGDVPPEGPDACGIGRRGFVENGLDRHSQPLRKRPGEVGRDTDRLARRVTRHEAGLEHNEGHAQLSARSELDARLGGHP